MIFDGILGDWLPEDPLSISNESFKNWMFLFIGIGFFKDTF
jgi:hypothetical protein